MFSENEKSRQSLSSNVSCKKEKSFGAELYLYVFASLISLTNSSPFNIHGRYYRPTTAIALTFPTLLARKAKVKGQRLKASRAYELALCTLHIFMPGYTM